MKLRGDDRDCRHNRRFISDPPVEDFAPEIRFDWEDDHLRRLARLVCMAASVLAPDGELSAFDNAIEDYRYYDLHYPDYHAAYEGQDARTFRRDKQAVRQVLLLWKDDDTASKQQDEDVLSYALFPQVAVDFFKYRQAQQTKVDATVADTENGAYPV